MRKKLSTLLLATLLLSSMANASTIFGGYDCGQWVNRPRGNSSPAESWVIGYLSGLNVAHERARMSPPDPLDALNSADQAYLWLDNFCRANPLRKLDGAANELFAELKANKK